jgi:hypothetical protein
VDYRNDVTYAAEPETRQPADYELKPVDDFIQYLREYTRERPEVVAMTCFGIGFVLGWKLKPW